MKKGLVSVILPTYNRAEVLPNAVESVLGQTYNKLELIVVDDGSQDTTKEIVREFQQYDDRVIYLKNKRNLGANVARNVGIKQSSGEFIAFIDSDDVWVPWKLERQIEFIKTFSSSCHLVYSGFIRIYQIGGRTLPVYYPQSSLSPREKSTYLDLLINANFIGLPTVLVTARNIHQEKVFFDEKMPRLQDWEFFLRLSKNCNFTFIPEPLVISYVQSDSISMNHKKFIKALKILYNKYYSKTDNRKALSTLYFLMGYAMFLSGKLDESKHYLSISLELNNKKISALSLWVSLKYLSPTIAYKARDFYFKISNYVVSRRLGINLSEYVERF